MVYARLKVQEVARAKNMSMGMLSRLSNVTYNSVKAVYRNPYREISTATLVRLAFALKVEPGELIEVVDDETAQAEIASLKNERNAST